MWDFEASGNFVQKSYQDVLSKSKVGGCAGVFRAVFPSKSREIWVSFSFWSFCSKRDSPLENRIFGKIPANYGRPDLISHASHFIHSKPFKRQWALKNLGDCFLHVYFRTWRNAP
jgi:hypothetical protein